MAPTPPRQTDLTGSSQAIGNADKAATPAGAGQRLNEDMERWKRCMKNKWKAHIQIGIPAVMNNLTAPGAKRRSRAGTSPTGWPSDASPCWASTGPHQSHTASPANVPISGRLILVAWPGPPQTAYRTNALAFNFALEMPSLFHFSGA